MLKKFINIKTWARSAGNQEIELYCSKALENIAPGQAVLYLGGVHGDEPEGVRLAKDWLEHLLYEHKPAASEWDWVLIPCINPDGFTKKERCNANGVDLNRNFPSVCWSPESKAPRYFPGAAANSEPEVQALVDLIQKIKPQMIIHFHSWQPMIVYSNSKAKNLAEQFSQLSQYPMHEDIGYPTPGSLGEYAGKDLDIGVICIEEQEGMDLNQVFPRFRSALIQSLLKK